VAILFSIVDCSSGIHDAAWRVCLAAIAGACAVAALSARQ
jgi:hypothetical protein